MAFKKQPSLKASACDRVSSDLVWYRADGSFVLAGAAGMRPRYATRDVNRCPVKTKSKHTIVCKKTAVVFNDFLNFDMNFHAHAFS